MGGHITMCGSYIRDGGHEGRGAHVSVGAISPCVGAI